MKLARSIYYYSVINVICAVVPFVLLPVLTAYLSPAEFGELSLVLMLQTLLIPLVLINFNGLIAVEYSKLDQEQFLRLVGTIIWLPIMGYCVMALLLFVFRDGIAKLFSIPTFWVAASAFIVLLQAMPTLILSMFQAEKNLGAFGSFKISMTLLNLSLSIIFVIGFKYGWEGRVGGIAGAYALFTALSLLILARKRMLKLNFDSGYFRSALKFGIPLIPHALSGTLLAMVDRLFQVNMLTQADVGVYSVAFQVASVVMIIMSSINQAWSPYLFEQLNSAPSEELMRKLVVQTYRIMGAMLGVVIGFVVIVPLVFNLFISDAYLDGAVVTMMIGVAMLFQGFYFMVTNYIFYMKKTHLLSIMTLVSAAIVMLLNYVLIPHFGIMGSAYAMVSGWFVSFLLVWRLAHRVYPMPWFLK